MKSTSSTSKCLSANWPVFFLYIICYYLGWVLLTSGQCLTAWPFGRWLQCRSSVTARFARCRSVWPLGQCGCQTLLRGGVPSGPAYTHSSGDCTECCKLIARFGTLSVAVTLSPWPPWKIIVTAGNRFSLQLTLVTALFYETLYRSFGSGDFHGSLAGCVHPKLTHLYTTDQRLVFSALAPLKLQSVS